ncbi:16S rRNA (adenine(1518)-N(6)/adenine(1519)-N(6))-dimethyltransferase RsmA [Acetobacter fabarum]|uniref:16S rRNA (adenine(1518)-N(6)/adenine(1519)-N(6))- dimethyltransferase RsmA n=1 Tax=Acetobacter fabarum TaxID=483199 RepID=UPI0033B8D2A4|nr:16S rRNA (adenine(1518)-N(6)/adenine(1519)-N(6))-dimethyltransferase RsmA [Acetobacter fabarum]MCI1908378.1 16S rRNA (adenine(1518)-N(6)/adenine(1519)-N(6))-dimethyltransferase RsmA [Acetobacter fabarum]MCI1926911.1 16S rRNA (adenine(1518)-N(6)/adenine(1519)-N(6))-dimethyltransferase RsmA [Acetobacter fabarum]MCI1946910.1 16S rRNA (adenine(1518)-N(6)/adenine(1519)-N(6))-dimethyltransferase RsmA [Acetobacter fabarum]MCI1987868.1 16S rRNA (adenine(1518)-N(6)/adenine(1519)-N(6))-dimethyltransfe
MPPELESLRDVIRRHELDARKALGQHFLLDPGITDHIAALAGALDGQHVVEVGPGPGGLTRSLLAAGATSVTAVELDSRAVAVIQELAQFYPDRLSVVEADALKQDLTALCPAPRQIIANLPYNVATPLLVGWLRQGTAWGRLTLMFQLEVAERICAAPDSEHYGRLAVLSQWCADCAVVMKLPPGAFTPPPAVWSAVASITPHREQPAPALFKAMERVTAAAFGQRRKMLRGSLKSLNGAKLLDAANIDGTRRAETLSIAEFDQLARAHLALG